MPIIEKFLGKQVEIPEDRRYYIKQGLWAASGNKEINFGLTQASILLIGGLTSLDWLVPDRSPVHQGDSIIFAITGKILYIETPVSGIIHFNDLVKDNPSIILEDPYDKGWIFKIKPETAIQDILRAHQMQITIWNI